MSNLPSITANNDFIIVIYYTWQIRHLLLIIQLLVWVDKSIITNYNKQSSVSVILGNSAFY